MQLTPDDRVDFLVEGWLIIECDSRAFHEGWRAQAADRRRDLRLAALGYATIRPIAADIFADAPALGRVITSMLAALPARAHNVSEQSSRERRNRLTQPRGRLSVRGVAQV